MENDSTYCNLWNDGAKLSIDRIVLSAAIRMENEFIVPIKCRERKRQSVSKDERYSTCSK